MRLNNPYLRPLIVGILFIVWGVLLMILPRLASIEGMSGGYGLMFIGGVVLLTALMLAGVYFKLWLQARAVLGRQACLLSLQMDDQSKIWLQKEKASEVYFKRVIAAVLWILIGIIAFIVWLMDTEALGYFLAMLVGVGGGIFLVVWIYTAIELAAKTWETVGVFNYGFRLGHKSIVCDGKTIRYREGYIEKAQEQNLFIVALEMPVGRLLEKGIVAYRIPISENQISACLEVAKTLKTRLERKV